MLVGTSSCELLVEEEYDERGSIDLCPKHALDYGRQGTEVLPESVRPGGLR